MIKIECTYGRAFEANDPTFLRSPILSLAVSPSRCKLIEAQQVEYENAFALDADLETLTQLHLIERLVFMQEQNAEVLKQIRPLIDMMLLEGEPDDPLLIILAQHERACKRIHHRLNRAIQYATMEGVDGS